MPPKARKAPARDRFFAAISGDPSTPSPAETRGSSTPRRAPFDAHLLRSAERARTLRSARQANRTARDDSEASPSPGLEYIDPDPPWGAPPHMLPSLEEEEDDNADPDDIAETLEVRGCLFLEETMDLLALVPTFAPIVADDLIEAAALIIRSRRKSSHLPPALLAALTSTYGSAVPVPTMAPAAPSQPPAVASAPRAPPVSSEPPVAPPQRKLRLLPPRPPPGDSPQPPRFRAPPPRPSYASVAAPRHPAPAPRPPAPPPAAPPATPGPVVSTTLRRARSCTSQGTKTNKVVFRPPGDGLELPSAAEVRALIDLRSDNEVIAAMWTLRGDLEVTLRRPASPDDIAAIEASVLHVFPSAPSRLARPTTSRIKFLHVATMYDDKSPVSPDDLLAAVRAHPRWAKAAFFNAPRFVFPKGRSDGPSATVLCEVFDDRASLVAHRLLSTDILFNGAPHRAQPWTIKQAVPQCGICLRWGHTLHSCISRQPWCAVCSRNHPTSAHTSVEVPSLRTGQVSCINCRGQHSATSRLCEFYKARFQPLALATMDKGRQIDLAEQRSARRKTRAAARNS